MPRTDPRTPSLLLVTAIVVAVGCGGGNDLPAGPGGAHGGRSGSGPMGAAGTTGTAGTVGPGGPGAAGAGGKPMGMKPMPGMMGTAGTGAIVIGVPTSGSPGIVYPGGGPSGSAPLAAGCTPGSAHECPSASGTCATSASAKPTGTTTGSICFYGPITTTTTTTSSTLAATIEYLHETAGGQEYYRFRIIFDPRFVDNTYGANAIGWTKGHTFKDLVGSDHAELSLFDGTSTMVSMFDIDYITANTASACAYGALGVSGGEGKMLVGDAAFVLASTTSLDRDLNGCGYCKSSACGGDCTVDSPATDANYTINPAAPNWDYRVVYEVWIDAAVFGSKDFGGASITFVHASPSKASSNTVTVTPMPCGGDCLPGSHEYITSEGAPACVPNTPCPTGYTTFLTSEGATCVPVPTNGVCPNGYHLDPESEGSRCI